MKLYMEIECNEHHVQGRDVSYDISVHPTQTTYEILNTWEQATEKYPGFPYPEELISNKDWYHIVEKSFSIERKL